MNDLVHAGVFEADEFGVEEDLGGAVAFLADLDGQMVSMRALAVSKVKWYFLTLIRCPSGSA